MTLTVGIAGITGKFAGLVLTNLLKHPDVNIRGFCRNPSKLPEATRSSSRVQITQGESTDRDALNSFVKGTDVVICAYLGDNDLMVEGQKLLIDACEEQGVPRYIASDYSLDFTKLEYGQHPGKDPMKTVKEYVDSKTTVKGVHVLIGCFMETFWSTFLQMWNPEEKSFTYWGSGEEVWESTTYGTAAEYVAAVAMDPKAVGLQQCKNDQVHCYSFPQSIINFLTVLGDRKSTIEIAEIFEKVYGVKPQLKRAGSLDELYKNMQQIYQKDPGNVYAYLPL